MALVTKNFSDIITFTRASGATWFNSAGILQGVDFSVTSNTIGTGSKTFTLTATGGVNRYWTAGDTVLISDQANSANNMVGTVTSYNASTQVLVCNITSTGGSGTLTAWRIGSTMPRFDYNPTTLAAQGLLIEEQRTNRIANTVGSGSISIGTGSAIGPNGQPMNTAIIGSGAMSFPQLGVGSGNAQSFTLTAGQSIDVALSGWFAAGTAGMIIEPRLIADFRTAPSTNFTYAELQINTSTWTVRSKTLGVDITEVSAPSITLFSTGVYRVTWVVRYTQGATIRDASGAYIQLRDSTGSGTFTGDGIGNFQYFGLQGETGSFPTSYIPTTTTALTRNADQASVNTLSPWYNATEGTLFAEYVLNGYTTGTFPCVAQLGVAGIGNRGQQFVVNVSSAQVSFNVYDDAGAYQGVGSPSGPTTLNTVFKAAGTYKANDSAVSFNANAPVTDTTVTLATGINRLAIGQFATLVTPINGYIRRITYYPRRLANADLQTITA